MAEVAPSAASGGGNRSFLLIIGGLAALLFIGLLVLAALLILPALFGAGPVAGVLASTPTRIAILATATRGSDATATLVVEPTIEPTPTLAAGESLLLVNLDADNNATLTTLEGAKAAMVQKGTWTYEPGTGRLVLSLDDLNGQTFKDELVLELQGDELTALSYNRALHGDLAQAQIKRTGSGSPMNQLLPPRVDGVAYPAAQATATPNPVSGGYLGSVPGPEADQRVLALYLGVDGAAVFSTAEAGKDSLIQIGTWSAAGSTVTVKLTLRDNSPFEDTLVLNLSNDVLIGTKYDESVHGSNLRLARDPNATPSAASPAAGTYIQIINLGAATPVAITATPIAITATPGASRADTNLPQSGLGEDLLLLFSAGVFLIGIMFVARRLRSA